MLGKKLIGTQLFINFMLLVFLYKLIIELIYPHSKYNFETKVRMVIHCPILRKYDH